MEKKFVRISSERPIQVTCGLQYENFTDKKSQVADKLKVAPTWFDKMVILKQGSHFYPSEIAEWNTVKLLAKDKKITIGEFTDDCENDVEAINDKKRLKENDEKTKLENEVKSEKKLADIAGE